MKKTLVAYLCYLTISACKHNSEQSKLNDITGPDEQVIGSAREFWFYASEGDGLRSETANVQVAGVKYLPNEMPLNDDFFSIAPSSATTLDQIEFGLSMDPNILRSVPKFKNVMANGEFLQLQLVSDGLSRIGNNNRWQMDFQPTFITRPRGANVPLEMVFKISNVCYAPEFFEPSHEISNLDGLIYDTLDLEKTFKSVATDQSPTFAPTFEYRPAQIKEFVSRCSEKNGQIASSINLNLRATT